MYIYIYIYIILYYIILYYIILYCIVFYYIILYYIISYYVLCIMLYIYIYDVYIIFDCIVYIVYTVLYIYIYIQPPDITRHQYSSNRESPTHWETHSGNIFRKPPRHTQIRCHQTWLGKILSQMEELMGTKDRKIWDEMKIWVWF